MSEQPLDLKATVGAIWGRRRLVGALAGIGLLGGLAYGIVSPAMPSAVALVLMPPTSLTSSGTPTRDVQTEIVIATSTPVLTSAGKAVSPAITPIKLAHQVTVTALSQDVLQIQARAANAPDAKRLANAVATDYIQFLATSSSASTRRALAGLQHESAQLTQQIQGLQSQINTVSTRLTAEGASSPGGQQDSSLLGSLGNEQQQVSLQLDNVNNQVVTDQLSSAAAAQGTRILQRANTVAHPSTLRVVVLGFLGMLVGLVAGVPIALIRSRRDRRLRRRDDLAGAVGAPVVGSVEAPQCKTPAHWTELLGRYEPSSVDAWNLRRLLSRVAPGAAESGAEIVVVSFAGDRAAMAAGAQLALFAEGMGLPTTLVPGEGEVFSSLRAACATRPRPDRAEHLAGAHSMGVDWDRPGAQLTVAMEAVRASAPTLQPTRGAVVLAVSPGVATADALARVALAAVDSGHAIDAILLVNPDPADATTGVEADPDTAEQARWSTRGFGRVVSGDVEVPSRASVNGNGATAHHEEPDDEPGAFISLRVVAAAARRHWRPLAAVALLGMVMGASLHLVVPRKYAATANLYLTEPAALDPAEAMANDVSLLQTRAVADRSIAALHLHTTTTALLASYQGVAISNAILQITVSGHSSADSVSRANAVARAFLSVRTELLRLQTQVVVSGLKSQVASLNTEVNNLTTSIDALSGTSTATSSSDQLADLVDQRSEDTSQVSTLESQIQQQQLNEIAVTQASQILDGAAPVKVSSVKVTVIDAVSGLIGALGLALVVLIAVVLLSDRLRSRAQVAAALGAPVELSLLRYAPRRAARARHRKKLLEHPTPELSMIERRLRAQLESTDGAALIVVEVEAAEPCTLAVAVLASSLAAEGRSVVMADMAKDRPLASLFGVTSREKELHTVTTANESAAYLIVGPDDPAEMGHDWIPNGADALLLLATVDPAFGSEYLTAWANKAVVLVNARKTTAARVSATGALLRQARIAIRSAIVIGVDPHDDDSLGGVGANQSGAVEPRTNGVLQAAEW